MPATRGSPPSGEDIGFTTKAGTRPRDGGVRSRSAGEARPPRQCGRQAALRPVIASRRPLEQPFELRHAFAKPADLAVDLIQLVAKRLHLSAKLPIGRRDRDQDHDPGADYRPRFRESSTSSSVHCVPVDARCPPREIPGAPAPGSLSAADHLSHRRSPRLERILETKEIPSSADTTTLPFGCMLTRPRRRLFKRFRAFADHRNHKEIAR